MFDESESLDCGELADEASLEDAYFYETRLWFDLSSICRFQEGAEKILLVQ